MHRVYFPHLSTVCSGDLVEVVGDEARHALRVKRLRPGERVELLDGQGGIATGQAEPDAGQPSASRASTRRGSDGALRVRVASIARIARQRPIVEVWCATPKGSRVEDMIEQLSEIGVSAWVPMHTERTIVDPRDAKLDRLRRIAQESGKQSGRAWTLEVRTLSTFDQAIAPPPGSRVLLGHWTGRVLDGPPSVPGDALIRLLIGPEGDFSPEELQRADASGVERVRFGPHVMRVATAAVAGSAVLMSRSI